MVSNTEMVKVLEREKVKWKNKGFVVCHNEGVPCPRGVMGGRWGHAESSCSISFQQAYELGCRLFLLLLQYCCGRKITKMLGKI